LIFIIVTSCSSHKIINYMSLSDSYARYLTSKSINLETTINSDSNYIEFENRNSLIILKQTKLLSSAKIWLMNDSLCIQKQKDIKTLIDKVENSVNGFYFIESMITPSEYKQFEYPSYKQYQKKFIYPYGFEIEVDTINKVQLKELKDWMISKMCISGDCMVHDKRTKTMVDSIYFDIVDFKDGHGWETLVFKDKKPFFNVKAYSDVAWPDYDCMSNEEINSYWNSARKNIEKRKLKK